MNEKTNWSSRQNRFKLLCLSLGVTLGASLAVFGQGCVASGQCATCGACAARLPVLALPLMADGAFIVVGKIKAGLSKDDDEDEDGIYGLQIRETED